ncbi:hypothetical protein [Qipengyuania sp. RANM35]|uniref:hypothetical protein n=1 Tax=Qipengyuania sp. RANM35 TaxID=3068635 RepID=UPI0034DAC669
MLFADAGQYFTDGGLQLAFDAPTGTYHVTNPASTSFEIVQRSPNYAPQAGNPWVVFIVGGYLSLNLRVSGGYSDPDLRYLYSNLITWSFGSSPSVALGTTAVGMPGPGLTSGSAIYEGRFEVESSRQVVYEGTPVPDMFDGTVELVFDASANTGRLTLVPSPSGDADPNSVTPVDLVWSAGASLFHQPDPASSTSLNYPVAGRFTGPAGQELIGGVRFEYTSKADGKTYEARGAFVAKK